MTAATIVFKSSLALCFLSAFCDACSCAKPSPVETMCKSDFAAKVLLMSPAKPAGEFDITYKIEYQAIFLKTEKFVNAHNDTFLVTASSSAACGVTLPFKQGANDNTYLIAGTVDDSGNVRLGLCDSATYPWFHLDPEDRKFLMKGELRNLCIENLSNV
uniref:NTR domain-containing protein n=1 Tax=Plectus sambesii TaxID=2011161 RepID=A0A914XHQ8_9BILA